MKKAFVSGRYHRGEYVAHDHTGKQVSMHQAVTPVKEPKVAERKISPRRTEIRIEPWVRKAIDDQNAQRKQASLYVAK